jgi:hypothetical protein
MTAALDANMNDLHMPAAAYTRSTWIVADDDDIPPLVAETVPFVPADSPADSPSDSPADSPSDSPADSPANNETSPANSETSPATQDTTATTTATATTTTTATTTDAMDTSETTESDYTWSDVSDSDEEDSHIPSRQWDGIPTAIVVLFFAYMFTQSIGIWSGRLWV